MDAHLVHHGYSIPTLPLWSPLSNPRVELPLHLLDRHPLAGVFVAALDDAPEGAVAQHLRHFVAVHGGRGGRGGGIST